MKLEWLLGIFKSRRRRWKSECSWRWRRALRPVCVFCRFRGWRLNAFKSLLRPGIQQVFRVPRLLRRNLQVTANHMSRFYRPLYYTHDSIDQISQRFHQRQVPTHNLDFTNFLFSKLSMSNPIRPSLQSKQIKFKNYMLQEISKSDIRSLTSFEIPARGY